VSRSSRSAPNGCRSRSRAVSKTGGRRANDSPTTSATNGTPSAANTSNAAKKRSGCLSNSQR
jgi:hypothetical protein